jgi:pimeloyl-ACP methyl ester carboxylesterase
VVGHDWGAVVAWALAVAAPERVERLVALSVGHPARVRRRTVEDRERSWYMLLFQFAEIAEALLARHDWALFREWVRADGDVEQYVTDLGRPGALTAALNWYRLLVEFLA